MGRFGKNATALGSDVATGLVAEIPFDIHPPIPDRILRRPSGKLKTLGDDFIQPRHGDDSGGLKEIETSDKLTIVPRVVQACECRRGWTTLSAFAALPGGLRSADPPYNHAVQKEPR